MGSKKFAPFMMKKYRYLLEKCLTSKTSHFKRVQKWGKICIYIIFLHKEDIKIYTDRQTADEKLKKGGQIKRKTNMMTDE
jgi:hypothetical protein